MASAADVYGAALAGILLTGANHDGAAGLAAIGAAGGLTVVQDPDEAQVDVMPRAAIRHFTYRAQATKSDLKDLLRQGRLSLLIGCAFVALCILLADLLRTQGTTPLHSVLREGLTIIGWVALWRPTQIFLYDWWPVWRRMQVLKNLARMRVELLVNDRGDGRRLGRSAGAVGKFYIPRAVVPIRSFPFSQRIILKKIFAALAVAAALTPFASAQAATISFAESKSIATTNWTDFLSFGKFDTSLGTLTSIKFDLSGTVQGAGSAESLDAAASSVTLLRRSGA
eukprot:gene858-1136_t